MDIHINGDLEGFESTNTSSQTSLGSRLTIPIGIRIPHTCIKDCKPQNTEARLFGNHHCAPAQRVYTGRLTVGREGGGLNNDPLDV